VYERIVVPLDGSDVAAEALPHAEALARLAGAPLHLLRVIDVAPLVPGGFGRAFPSPEAWRLMLEAEAAERASAGEDLARYARELEQRGLTATTEVRTGAVVPELLAATRPGDVVVMATHGRGGVSRWFLGSVAEALVRRATVPIMLIRAEDVPSKEDDGG